MAAPKKYAATAWYMEYREGTSDKFYEVIITESGVCMLRWGRRGSTGQNSVNRYASYDEARDQGLKQVFAKKSKGYVQSYGDFKFMATTEAIDYALRGNPTQLHAEFWDALSSGQFDGAKETVLKHYADFSESVKILMERAASGDTATTMDEYEQLERVWEEINDKHAEVSAAMSIAKMTLMQKLMAGTL
jgi:predicted DNA-binding WGR domain protein